MSGVAGQHIALVGGAGFIGHHLALALKERGADVHVIDSLQVNNLLAFSSSESGVAEPSFYLEILRERLDRLRAAGVPLHVHDARDYGLLTRRLNLIQPDIIVQLAAVAHAGRSNKDPYTTFDHSLRTLENALDNARGRVSRFVFFSSSLVYGPFHGQAVTEATLCEPVGIYGALKFAGEKLVIAYHQVFQLPYTIVRPAALYGEWCVSQRVVQLFIEEALRGRPLTIQGDGSDALDFTSISDLVDGTILAIESPVAANQIFNLSCGRARTIIELAHIVKQHVPTASFQHGMRDRLAPERGTLSIEKARRLLGYAPQISLEEGVAHYVAWYRERLSAGRPQAAVRSSVKRQERPLPA